MTAEHIDHDHFSWDRLGDIREGRPNLGQLVPVSVYRLLQYTMRDVLSQRLGDAQARAVFVQAGRVAGEEFCRHLLDTARNIDGFMAQLQLVLRDLSMGVMRVETMDTEKMEFIITVAEDLDCSGLPVSDETVCEYDEGFLAGIFSVYLGREVRVREIDCWASGERVCRFEVQAGEPVTP